MNKKILILCLITLGFLTISIGAASASTISVTDGTGDVGKYDENEEFVENISTLPNMDIEQLTCEQEGKEVTITMKLKDGGIIEKALDSQYLIVLYTTSPNMYVIYYTGIDLSDLGFTGEIIIVDLEDNIITEKSYSGVETNTLTIVFDLTTSYERIIGLAAGTTKEPETSDYSYYDDAPNNYAETETVFPVTEELYNATVKKSVSFSGTLEEGEPDDYEWFWTFENVKTVKEGQSTSYTFDIPGIYTGVLYVHDGQGNWGETSFTVNVTGTAGGGNDDNGGGGSPLLFIGLVIIIIVVGLIVVVVISRR